MEPQDILTPDELAQKLKLPKSWVYYQMRRGSTLPYMRVGRYLRFYWPDVSSWLESRKKTPGKVTHAR